MATSFNITTNFPGQYINELYTKELLRTESLSKVSLLPTLKGSTAILPRVDVSNPLKYAACDFSASGSIVMTEREVTATNMAVNLEECIDDLYNTWQAQYMRAGQNNSDVPPTLQEFILQVTVNGVMANIEDWFWGGAASSSSPTNPEFDGIYTQALADGGADVAGTTVTSSNVLTELAKITAYAAANSTFQGMYIKKGSNGLMDAKIYVALNVYAALQAAYYSGTITYGTLNPTPGQLVFQGYEVVPAAGIPADKAIMASPSNIWLVTDLITDANALRLLDMRETTGANSVRVVGRMNFGAAYRIRTELVLYA